MATRLKHPLVIITALAALLRLPTIAIESLWYDECFTAWLAGLPISRLIDATMGDVHPPTWYLIEWAMARALGNSEFSLRLISALAGVALIPTVWRLAKAFNFPRETQQAAALLAAVAPFAVYYSQEARAYSLIYLLSTLATIALLERRWLLLVIFSTFALYLHNLTFFYIAALGWLAVWHYRFEWRPLASFAAIGLLWLPWVIWGLIPQAADVADGFWVRPPTIYTPFFTLTAFVFSGKAQSMVLVTVPLLTIALIKAISEPTTARLPLIALVLIPLGLCIIVSMLATPVLVERVIGSSAIPLYLLIAPALVQYRHFWRGPRPSPQTAMLQLCFALVLVLFYAGYWGTARIGRYPWDFHLEPVLVELRPTDGFFHANLATYIILRYYLPNDQIVWKQANDLSQSLTNETKWAMDMDQGYFESVKCRRPRWWLAFYENPTTNDTERAEIARIVERYHGRKVTSIFQNQLVDARVYLIDSPCLQVAQ